MSLPSFCEGPFEAKGATVYDATGRDVFDVCYLYRSKDQDEELAEIIARLLNGEHASAQRPTGQAPAVAPAKREYRVVPPGCETVESSSEIAVTDPAEALASATELLAAIGREYEKRLDLLTAESGSLKDLLGRCRGFLERLLKTGVAEPVALSSLCQALGRHAIGLSPEPEVGFLETRPRGRVEYVVVTRGDSEGIQHHLVRTRDGKEEAVVMTRPNDTAGLTECVREREILTMHREQLLAEGRAER